MYARAPSGTRIERTEEKVALLEEFIKKTIPEHDLELIVSEIGVNADWSAAYTPNAGPMDAVIKVQLKEHRTQVGPGVRAPGPHRRGQGPAVPGHGLRLRRRRPGPRRHERGKIDADQHPGHRQEPADGPSDRRADPHRMHQDRRRGGRSDHPAPGLPRVRHRRGPRQGGRPGTDPGRHHEERRSPRSIPASSSTRGTSGSTRSAATSTSSACNIPRKTSSRSRRS